MLPNTRVYVCTCACRDSRLFPFRSFDTTKAKAGRNRRGSPICDGPCGTPEVQIYASRKIASEPWPGVMHRALIFLTNPSVSERGAEESRRLAHSFIYREPSSFAERRLDNETILYNKKIPFSDYFCNYWQNRMNGSSSETESRAEGRRSSLWFFFRH